MTATMLRSVFLAALVALPSVHATYRDEVGDIDFQYDLVGVPQEQQTFFHRPRPDDRASLLYTLSDVGVLGAVNPGSGALVWRHLLEDESDESYDATTTATTGKTYTQASGHGRLAAVDGEGWLAAGLGSSVHAWAALSGRSLWWMDFAGELVGLDVVAGAADTAASILALFREDGPASTATVLRQLSSDDGRVLWEIRDATPAGISQPLQVVAASDGRAFVISLHSSAGLRAVAVDLQTGRRLDDFVLGARSGADDLRSPADVLFIGGPAALPFVAWTDSARSKLRVSCLLSTKPQKHEFALPTDSAEVIIRTPRSLPKSASLAFVVHTRTEAKAESGALFHSGQVYKLDPTSKSVAKTHELPPASGPGAFAIGLASRDAETIYITRIGNSEMSLTSSASPSILGSWPITDSRIHAFNSAVSEIVTKPAGDGSISFAVRAAVCTDTDDWVLLRNGQLAWSRPEGLTGALAAALADRPESEQLVRALEQEAHSNPLAAYIHRVRRHIDDLEHLPAYLQTTAQRIISNILGSSSDSSVPSSEPDSFGFHKIAVLATKRGRLYGLDAASPGTIQWTKKAVDLAPGATWAVRRIHVDEARGVATVFGQTAALSVAVYTETGEAAESLSLQMLEAAEKDAEIVSTAPVTSAAGSWELAVLRGGKVAGGDGIPLEHCPRETIVVRVGQQLQGIRFVVRAATSKCIPEVTWTFVTPAGRIADIAVRPAHDPVASIGRVLGDRRVLYKYLNPNLAVVASVDEAAATLTTYLLDTVSGQVVAAATHLGVDGGKPVECLLFENTFMCTFFADYRVDDSANIAATIKGYHLTVSDLYESLEPNERGWGAAAAAVRHSSSSNETAAWFSSSLEPVEAEEGAAAVATTLEPAVVSQTWVVGARLRALAVSQTRQGITVRQVLAYLPGTHGVLGLPRVGAFLDARRPVGRDPTPAELEEGLTRYAPAFEVDPRLVVSHERDVVGIRAIVAAPTHVESTSVVLAFGRVDVFGTRVAPSLTFDLLDKSFGKASMLATVAALAVGVAVLRPMVTKKQIDMRWQAPL
ncbi:duf1620 domain containing protein [Grosmannia clavigera kw1407]|uniref:ER membrane protein complex subunit 1 n=1 Tax=Grosmannia clavigera (strain kw1407 / UAMH 11150) TaxID=655863 RepID=F0XJ76_GROCL|nr:duf1620 domain containing protein [Grosmannia clavigera kw1407]EFX02072.1 duf1620 domain containing protein [Grosmannia clavigera kw1407]